MKSLEQSAKIISNNINLKQEITNVNYVNNEVTNIIRRI